MNDPTVHEILVEAWNLIDRHGHTKGALGGPNRGFCAMGALAVAATGTTFGEAPAMRVAQYALEKALPEGEWLLGFNNAPERTKEEICDWFMAAIAATAPQPDLTLETRDSTDSYMEACHRMAAEWERGSVAASGS